MLSFLAMENFAKYTRQISLDGFGEDGQRKLAASKVALIGVGGVGSAALPLLAGAGFGEIALADFDRVSEHNLHRQTIYRADSSGLPKAELAARYASALNPDVRVKFFDGKLTDENADEILGGALLCIDATDTFESRGEVSRICARRGLDLIAATAAGFVSQNFLFGDGFYFDAVADISDSANLPRGLPIFPPAAHLSGVWAASAAIRRAVYGEYETGSFSMFDAKHTKFFTANIR